MQHIGWLKNDCRILIADRFIVASVVGVVEVTVFVTVYHYTIWHQRIQGHDFNFAVADNLRISISPQKQVRHQSFPECKRGYFRVRLIMKQYIQRMVDGFFFAAGIGVVIEVERKSGHSLCQDTQTGIHCGHLHGRAFGHRFAKGGATKKKTVGVTCSGIAGLVSRLKYSR